MMRHSHVLPPDDLTGTLEAIEQPALASDPRGKTRSFFVDVYYDSDGAMLAVSVEEHGPSKCASDERALMELVRDYFMGRPAVDVIQQAAADCANICASLKDPSEAARRIRMKYGVEL